MSSAGIEFRTAPVAPPAWRIDAATHRLCLALLLAAALALQSGLAGIGFLRLGADESARTLMALQLTWANALEPYIWPPFTKLLLGLALQVWPDPVLVPRLLASVAGLLTILAVVRLSDMIFGDRRIGLLAGLLSLLIPHRLIFATVPMSDIYAHLFLLLAAGCVLAWLRHGSVAQLLLGCLCVLLAETVRFEAALFGGTIGLLVLHRWLWRRELRAAPAILAGLLLGSFPLLWVLDTWAWYGSLEALSLTSRQYTAVLGTDRRLALYLSPLGRNLALDILWNPLLPAGVLALAWRLRRDAALRPWAAAFGAPLPLLTATMVLTFSIPTAAPWRTTGLWVLALLPFQASAMLWLARAAARFVPPRLAVAALLALALLPMAGRSALYVASGMRDPLTGGLRQEATAGRAALRLLGPVRHLVSPGTAHWVHLPAWQAAFPEARLWAPPGVVERARRQGIALHAHGVLGPASPPDWAEEMVQDLLLGAGFVEVAFLHRPTRTLVLCDTVQAMEPARLPWGMGLLVRALGAAGPRGGTPRHVRLVLARHRAHNRAAVRRLLALDPARVVFAHGAWFERDGAARLRQAFAWLG
ncbi:hypothetical protein [Paracraurococcus ruber]|uniref:Glycosyltransferase RgtA/B/C/D-like domain-containing protein n=1 Tax=Paracraurococcus ruber TaxID=77675 RepID=A0ABS1CYV7_9PROT|nr:hypothetical protein [Paracraurococcus ruber]MBK1659605.1 hypothetical protein [Paracraurococcus ruber]